jgi:uncharacterized oxidoreductase
MSAGSPPDSIRFSEALTCMSIYTVALRDALKHQVEVIELIPGPVATKITAGQSNLGGTQPLLEFVDEVLAQLGQQPTPSEILVDRSRGARFAERDGTFDQMLHQINAGG